MAQNKKQLIRRYNGRVRQIHIHQQKVRLEAAKYSPNYTLIKNWKKEITAWRSELQRIRKRLAQ
jgi:hypothetical protein